MGWARIKLEADQRTREDQRRANDRTLLPTNLQRYDLDPGRAIWIEVPERVLREGRTEVLLARQPRPAVMINGEKLLAELRPDDDDIHITYYISHTLAASFY